MLLRLTGPFRSRNWKQQNWAEHWCSSYCCFFISRDPGLILTSGANCGVYTFSMTAFVSVRCSGFHSYPKGVCVCVCVWFNKPVEIYPLLQTSGKRWVREKIAGLRVRDGLLGAGMDPIASFCIVIKRQATWLTSEVFLIG